MSSAADDVERMESVDAEGRKIDVPSALVHHWRGAVLIPEYTWRRRVVLESASPRQEDAAVGVRAHPAV